MTQDAVTGAERRLRNLHRERYGNLSDAEYYKHWPEFADPAPAPLVVEGQGEDAELRERLGRALHAAYLPENLWPHLSVQSRQTYLDGADRILPLVAAEVEKARTEGAISALRDAAAFGESYDGDGLLSPDELRARANAILDGTLPTPKEPA